MSVNPDAPPAEPCFVLITTTPLVAREPYIAVAAPDLSTSMDSISCGFKSATRFTRASWLPPMPAAVVRAPALVMELAPAETASLEMITPSTTKSGWPAPRIDVTPRICICAPPPGAPLFIAIIAPGTFPCNACSIDCAGALFRALVSTVTVLVGALRFSIEVA